MTPTIRSDTTLPHAARVAPRENFPVLSIAVPRALRPGFAAVYSFCRVSDDIADDPTRSTSQRLSALAAWRDELDRCYRGDPHLPLFKSLQQAAERYALPPEPFHRLLDAFEQDQIQTRYDTWDDLVRYAERSANPVGELVLRIGGHTQHEAGWTELLAKSDSTCTALQFVNFWQDVRRDLLNLDRVYLPLEQVEGGVDHIAAMAAQPRTPDAVSAFRRILEPLTVRTDAMMQNALELPAHVDPALSRSIRLFQQAGLLVSQRIRACGFATLWQRPRISKASLIRMTFGVMLQPRRATA